MHWALGEDKVDKKVDSGAVSICQCLSLSFKGLLSKESGYEGCRHWSLCSVNESIYCKVLNQVEQYNRHQKSSSNRKTIRVEAPSESEPEWTRMKNLSGNPNWKPWVRNPEEGCINITLKYNSRISLLKSRKYTMWLQYCYSKEGPRTVQTCWECSNSLN